MVYLKEFGPSEMESNVVKIERESLVIRLVLRRKKMKKVALKKLISKINSNLVRDIDTTKFIRETRDRVYA